MTIRKPLAVIYTAVACLAIAITWLGLFSMNIYSRMALKLLLSPQIPMLALVALRLVLLRRRAFDVDTVLLWCLVGAYVLSALLNQELAKPSKNERAVYYVMFYVAVGYDALRLCSRENRNRTLRALLTLLCAMIAVMCMIGLYAFMQNIRLQFPHTKADWYAGLNDEGRLALFCHPNTTGVYCYVGIFAALALALHYRRVWTSVLAGLETVLLLLTLSLTDSRSSRMLLSVMIALGGAVVMWQLLAARKEHRARFVALGAACVIAATALSYAYWPYAMRLMNACKASKAQQASAWLVTTASAEEATVQPLSEGEATALAAEEAAALDPSAEDATTTAAPTAQATPPASVAGAEQRFDGAFTLNLAERDLVWKACVEMLLKDHKALLIGYSIAGAPTVIVNAGFAHGMAHNSFLEVWMRGGLLALLPFAAFAVRLAWHALCVMFDRRRALSLFERLLPVFLVAFAIHAMTESLLPDLQNVGTLLFFVLAGAVNLLFAETRQAPRKQGKLN